MSESQNEDADRKERARRVAALAGASRQPGERARIGTRIAGAVATIALAASATLGIGAWHSYSEESAEKEAKAAELRKKQQAAMAERATPSPSPSETKHREKPEKKQAPPPSPEPTRTVEKPKKKAESGGGMAMDTATYSGVSFANQSTKMCADLQGGDSHPGGAHLYQHVCDAGDTANQKWNVDAFNPTNGKGGKGVMTISSTRDNTCLDLPDYGGAPSGTHVSTAGCTDNKDDNEQWQLEQMSDGSKRIRNPLSKGLCLQVDGDPAKYSRIIIGDCDAPSARWVLKQ